MRALLPAYPGRLCRAIRGAFLARAFSQDPPSSVQSDLRIGASHSVTKAFSAEEVLRFLSITGDTNPLHYDAAAAKAAGFSQPILPGILMASLFPAIIGSKFPGALYLTQSLSFRTPATVGQTVIATVTVSKHSGSRVVFSTSCTTPEGVVLVDGSAMALIRSPQ